METSVSDLNSVTQLHFTIFLVDEERWEQVVKLTENMEVEVRCSILIDYLLLNEFCS